MKTRNSTHAVIALSSGEAKYYGLVEATSQDNGVQPVILRYRRTLVGLGVKTVAREEPDLDGPSPSLTLLSRSWGPGAAAPRVAWGSGGRQPPRTNPGRSLNFAVNGSVCTLGIFVPLIIMVFSKTLYTNKYTVSKTIILTQSWICVEIKILDIILLKIFQNSRIWSSIF